MCQMIEHEKELIEKNLNILEKTKKYDGYNP
jgi:hypothetical protein